MATKRKLREEEIKGEAEKKMARKEDRLSNLPHDLQLRILSSLDPKDAFKISVLSKTWGYIWNCIPLLKFDHSVFNNLHRFDKFVNRVLSQRNRSANLDRLTFNRRGICSAKILRNVFDYAFSHGIKQLEAYIDNSRNHTWPVCVGSYFESLTNLKLRSGISISCPFLGPRSGSFKNLKNLYLERAIITDFEPEFPVLESLTLISCEISTVGETLSIHARNLIDLTISGYQSFSNCKLITPRLEFFEYQGPDFPQIRIDEGLPVFDTMVIGYNGLSYRMQEKRMFEDLLSLFCALPNAICLKLFSPIVNILSLFQNQLVKRSSPFWKLMCLELDLSYPEYKNQYDQPWPLDSFGISSTVKAYLLQNSPNAKVRIICPKCKTSCTC